MEIYSGVSPGLQELYQALFTQSEVCHCPKTATNKSFFLNFHFIWCIYPSSISFVNPTNLCQSSLLRNSGMCLSYLGRKKLMFSTSYQNHGVLKSMNTIVCSFFLLHGLEVCKMFVDFLNMYRYCIRISTIRRDKR